VLLKLLKNRELPATIYSYFGESGPCTQPESTRYFFVAAVSLPSTLLLVADFEMCLLLAAFIV
jgi:hypothetical protein